MTFKESKERILNYLESRGWDVKRRGPSYQPLKISHATYGDCRVYFLPQAVHMVTGSDLSMKYARSLWIDIRRVAPETFENEVLKRR
jgi:hypothetical protein